MDNTVFHKLSYGVYAVLCWDEGRPTGCTANSIMQIMAEPPSIAVSINRNNYTNKCIKDVGKFSVSILSEQSDPAIIGKLGFFSGRDTDKLKDIPYSIKGYMPVIDDSCGYMVCEVENTVETDTHTVFFARVVDGAAKDGVPMTYAYYHNVVKGKTAPNAPTYIKE